MSTISHVPKASSVATRTRYGVIVFAVTLAIISYIDRVCLSQAKPLVAKDLHLNNEQMGAVLGAFGLGYALFEIPLGYLGDWKGPRRVITFIVVWWSIFTALTGAAVNMVQMWIVRFGMGCGEAGGFPVMTKVFSVWLQPAEKTRAQAIMWTFARLGGAVTPLLVYYTLQVVNWRLTLVLFGSIGLVWVAIWWWWYRDNPAEHPRVNEAEADLLRVNAQNTGSHANVPWGVMLKTPTVWLLGAQYFLVTYSWYFYITWLPSYLKEFRHVDDAIVPRLAFLPLFFGAIGCAFSGWILKYMAQKWGWSRARRGMSTLGMIGAAIAMVICIQMQDPVWSTVVLALSSFFNDLSMPPSWGTAMDVGGKFAGTLSGAMNMMGNLAGFFAPWLGGIILQRSGGDYLPFMYTMALAYVLAAFCWPFIDPVTPLKGEQSAH